MGPPAVAYDTVYVTSRGDEPNLTALDVATGDLRWQESGLGSETNLSPTVAGGLVFLVADKVLYALDAHGGERRWQFEPGTVTTDDGQERGDYLQRDSVAVAGGTVFALSNKRLIALDAETGDERWTDGVDDWASSTFSGRPIAADGVAAAVKAGVVTIYDAETGTERSTVPTHSLDVLTDDRVYAVTDAEDGDRKTVTGYDSETGIASGNRRTATDRSHRRSSMMTPSTWGSRNPAWPRSTERTDAASGASTRGRSRDR